MKFKTEEELQALIDTYTNGNKSDFRETLYTLNAYDTARLIRMWQPYHSAIATIENSYELYKEEVYEK